MQFDLYIKQGRLVQPSGTIRAGVLVKDGRIAGLVRGDERPQASRVIDASGKYILPGLIDVHVHFRTPGLTYKEDFYSGSLAAVCGGITTVIDMPNVSPPTSGADNLAAKLSLVAGSSWVNFGFLAALTRDNLSRLEKLAETGAAGFKLFMNEVSGSLTPPGGEALKRSLEIISGTGLCCAVHAEEGQVIAARAARLKQEGRTDPLAHLESRPAFVEAEAIRRIVNTARETGGRLHICHLSSREGAEQVRAAKELVNISAETAPHYLLLDSFMMERRGSLLKVNPPLRLPDHREALWEALSGGTVEALASDHAPHTPEEKLKPDIWEAVSGFCGVETLVPLMLTEVNKGRLSLNRFAFLASENPARRFNLYPRKGAISEGSDADFTIIDLQAEKVLRAEELHSKSKVTPFDGFRVKGIPVATIIRGRVVMEGGIISGEPGGAFIRPVI